LAICKVELTIKLLFSRIHIGRVTVKYKE